MLVESSEDEEIVEMSDKVKRRNSKGYYKYIK